jgi:hypothetical protein
MWQKQRSHRALAKVGIRRETGLLNGRPLSLQYAGFNSVLFEIQRGLQTFGQLCMGERIMVLREVDVFESCHITSSLRSRSTSECSTRRWSGWS